MAYLINLVTAKTELCVLAAMADDLVRAGGYSVSKIGHVAFR